MGKIIDKISVIEEQFALVQTKAAPLASRLTNLNQAVQTLTDQIEDVGRETLNVQNEFDEMQASLEAIRNILYEVKQEGVELTEQQAETKQVCESLTTMFGEAFQVVSRFMETTQRMGIAKEEVPPAVLTKTVADEIVTKQEPAVEQVLESEPVEVGYGEVTKIEDTEPPVEEETKPAVTENTEPAPAGEETFKELAAEDMAAQLKVPPLPLNEPVPLPATSEVAELTEEEEQKLENLLMDLSVPITV